MKKSALDKWICDQENIPYLTGDILDDLQLTKLNALLAKEKRRGGFYADLPEYLTSLKELESLPFTTAEDLAENTAALLLGSQSEVSRVISGVTSGTTGPSKRIFYSDGDLANTVTFFAAGISEMTAAGETVLITMPFSVSGGLGELIARAVELLGAKPIRAGSDLSYAELNEIMRLERPDSYIGMPVPLLSLLRFCGNSSTLKRALVSADVCPVSVRREIEGLLGSRLFPHYGLRECCLGGAVTCQAHAGMHVRENHIIAEIIEKNGKPVRNGDYGELVITTVGMEIMPLIRYRTGDRACILAEPCPCGAVSARIEVEGRLDDNLRMSDIDEALFDIKELVDVKAGFAGNVLELKACVLGNVQIEEEIQKRVSPLLSDNKLKISTQICEGSCKSLYSGKRMIG
ncbi:MAG TPA: phenylacetate--CoA ligase [Clostridiaceae bacterium]|nr:phenylacetate--CoA ligase [Clostridiaceae bacterium]